LFVRAKTNGLLFGDTKVHTLDDIVVPINIQYAWENTLPAKDHESYMEKNSRMFSNSCIRAPFPLIWFEWNEPLDKLDADAVERDPYPFLKTSADCCALLIEKQDKTGFTLALSWFEQAFRHEFKQAPVILLCNFDINYSLFERELTPEDALTFRVNPFLDSEYYSSSEVREQFSSEALGSLGTVLWSLVLLGCKNVSTIETMPIHRSTKQQKDPNRLIHKELCIEVPGKKYVTTASLREEDNRTGVAFHIRRGHLADYTEGKGLFGKYHGKYWIPSMTVGDAEHGTVIKSYKLKGGGVNCR
jgi:hypothetical protein